PGRCARRCARHYPCAAKAGCRSWAAAGEAIKSGVKFHDGAHLDRAVLRAWNFGGPGHGLVEVRAIERVKSAQLLLGFGEGAVGGLGLAFANTYRRGRAGRLQGFAAAHLPAGASLLRESIVGIVDGSLLLLAGL